MISLFKYWAHYAASILSDYQTHIHNDDMGWVVAAFGECTAHLLDIHPPGFTNFTVQHDKEYEDDDTLESHQDGVDVGERDQFLHLHYQHTKYPR